MSSFGHLFYKLRIKVDVVNPRVTDIFSMILYLINVIIHHALLNVNTNNFLT